LSGRNTEVRRQGRHDLRVPRPSWRSSCRPWAPSLAATLRVGWCYAS